MCTALCDTGAYPNPCLPASWANSWIALPCGCILGNGMNENSGHPAGHLKQLHVSFHFLFSLLQLKRENSDVLEVSIGEGNGNPLSSPLAWKIPWTEEPGRLQSMGSLIVGHD